MPIANHIPKINSCCGCVTDLKVAAAIIAVMGIVTSPALSWAVVRHAYVIRVSGFVTSSVSRPDVVDINLNNILSFGFGANAGLGPSCLGDNKHDKLIRSGKRRASPDDGEPTSGLVSTVKYCGWLVLLVDVIFLLASLNFLLKMFRGADKSAAKTFIITALVCTILSFIYGLLFVGTCIYVGGSFPIFELFFSIIDLIMWLYFLIVVNSYRQKST